MTTIPMLQHDFTGSTEPIIVYGLSDLHEGSSEANVDAFKRLTDTIMSSDNQYCVLVGDLIDNATKSSVSNVYEAIRHPDEQLRMISTYLRPLATSGRILGMVGGNHEYRTKRESDIDLTRLVAADLRIEHLYDPHRLYLRLKLNPRLNGNSEAPDYSILLTHGVGGGSKPGGTVNKLEDFAIRQGADLLVVGHTHKPVVFPTVRHEVITGRGIVIPRKLRIMICTGWLECGGYATRKMMVPVDVAPTYAEFHHKQKNIKLTLDWGS